MNIDTNLEAFLKEQISQGLDIPMEDIDVEQPLIEIGADSLVLMSMISVVQAKYNVKLSMIQLFEEVESIAALVRYITEHQKAAEF